MSERIERLERIMDAFGVRTGLTSDAVPRRYLWTDAFAVCNYLALHRHTGASRWLGHARRLIDQVHAVLGRHRADDTRTGWISGLGEEDGARHPTAGGLRIGKKLPERGPTQLPDDRIDWDRDGQYYHYLTRWMHALSRAAAETGDAELLRYGVELARSAHAAFAHREHGESRLYWKMSVDLSRPVVASMGQHDALDGFVTVAGLRAQAKDGGMALPDGDAGLDDELVELSGMCRDRQWGSTDLLGIGGLLADAWFLAQPGVISGEFAQSLLPRLLRDAARSLDQVASEGYLDGPAWRRLPFRELGLGIGLAAVERMAEHSRSGTPPPGERDADALRPLLGYVHLRNELETFWEEPANQSGATWTEHEDINAVMLATSLLPDGYLGGGGST